MIRTDAAKTSPPGIIPGSHVHMLSEPARVGQPGHETHAEPIINIIRDGDTVRAIEVICTCGKRTVLSCVY